MSEYIYKRYMVFTNIPASNLNTLSPFVPFCPYQEIICNYILTANEETIFAAENR
jgi:hypothetical protein